ncbi:putative purine permease, plant [Rosa chinensis]|uniref:Putative purine permease, plant n=1 Tax=Rosa chinensis TaxID=74649 RepID=A0A2P6P9L0_ROSCH|nr:putative purine permease, plant [Rosa chinensis]
MVGHGPRLSLFNTNSGLNSSGNRLESTNYKWWLRVTIYTVFLLTNQPVLLPLLCFFSSTTTLTTNSIGSTTSSSASKLPKLTTMVFLYIALGLLLTADNMMYSYGLLFLPVSTYSLLCAT